MKKQLKEVTMIRNLKKSDMKQLNRLYRQFWNEESDISAMEMLSDKLEQDPAYMLLGAFDEQDTLIGSVMGIVCQELYGDCLPFLVLENMVVDEAARGKGIGRALVAELEDRARSAGCRQILLVTEKSRTDACSFYEALGFSRETTGYKKKIR